MIVSVIGTRGFPNIQGGVEKHCESLYPLIAEKGWRVRVFRRTPYVHQDSKGKSFHNIEFRDLWAPRNKNFESIMHSFIAAIACLYERPDIVHIHNIGPSLVLPLLKIGGLTTVVTYHSPNYEHEKWGMVARWLLRLGQYFTTHWANKVIFVSSAQSKLINCPQKICIPNGVTFQAPTPHTDFLSEIGVPPNGYILAVARLTPEKGLHDLMTAFKRSSSDCKLLIAGDADHETSYKRRLYRIARDESRIIFAGYITGEKLNQVYTHAKLFVLPSHSEGFPIALLEAMSYGLPVLVSDIPANKEIRLPTNRYFRCGDVSDLKTKIEELLAAGLLEKERQAQQSLIRRKYNWNNITKRTIDVYQRLIAQRLD